MKSDVERRLQERGLSTVFDPVVKMPLSSASGAGSAVGQVSISRLMQMPDVGVGRCVLRVAAVLLRTHFA